MFKNTYIISNKHRNFSINNANIIFEEDIFNASFSAIDNIYIDIDLSSDLKRTILDKAKLNIKEYTFKKDALVVNAYTRANLNSNSKYTQTTKGYVGEDTISLATLEIEEIGRVAYEHSKSVLLNVDYSSSLISSNLWRKVLNNINEDYPNIEIININVEDVLNMPIQEGVTLVIDPVIVPLALDAMRKKGFSLSTVYTCPSGLRASLIEIK